MAKFKTAEQYVVEKLESVEADLERAKLIYEADLECKQEKIDQCHCELDQAYTLLNYFREFLTIRHSDYFGTSIDLSTIHSKEHPEAVARIMEYFDLRLEEDE